MGKLPRELLNFWKKNLLAKNKTIKALKAGGQMLEKIKNRTAKITIVGMGYIGLPTSIAFAEAGYEVYGYDVNEDVINTLKNGKIHIKEPDLHNLLKRF